MTNKTDIGWTEYTWNPLRGCSRVSTGCENCYAELIAARFNGPGQPYEGLATFVTNRDGKKEARWTGEIKLIREKLYEPLRWSKPRTVFVNSTSDLFHEKVPSSYIAEVFAVMADAKHSTFQVLTKRSKRLCDFGLQDRRAVLAEIISERTGKEFPASILKWPLPNVWLGVSVENQDYVHRIADLQATPAAIRFVSFEPLIGPIRNVDLTGIHWAIIGGEYGINARIMMREWVDSLIRQCREQGVKIFVKQLGARFHDDINGIVGKRFDVPYDADLVDYRLKHSKGEDLCEWPESLQIQEFPIC